MNVCVSFFSSQSRKYHFCWDVGWYWFHHFPSIPKLKLIWAQSSAKSGCCYTIGVYQIPNLNLCLLQLFILVLSKAFFNLYIPVQKASFISCDFWKGSEMPESALRLIQADLEWLLSKVHLGPFVYLLLFYGSSALKSQERLSKELTLSFIYKMLQDSNLMLPKLKCM